MQQKFLDYAFPQMHIYLVLYYQENISTQYLHYDTLNKDTHQMKHYWNNFDYSSESSEQKN